MKTDTRVRAGGKISGICRPGDHGRDAGVCVKEKERFRKG